MKQYQITLNQQSITTLDELENILQIPKAKIIQKALAKLKSQFTHVFTKPKQYNKKGPLDDLVGSIHIKGEKQFDYSRRVDEIYYR